MLSVHIPWDVDEYYSNNIKGGRDKKRIQFPNPQFGSQSKPLTVVDSKGRIVLWYLPGFPIAGTAGSTICPDPFSNI